MSKWKKVKLEEVCNFIDYRGKTPEKSEFGIPFITAKNVKRNRFSFEPREYITKETYDATMVRGYPKVDDILFTTEAPLGNVCRIPYIEGEFAVGQRIIVMQPHSEVLSSGYLDFALKSRPFQEEMWKASSGSTVKGIRSAKLVKLEIPLPPLDTQKQIAKTLDTVAELLAMRKQQLAELDNLIKATFYDMFGDPVTNEKGWEVVAVGKVTDCIVPSRDKPKSFTGDIPWITTSDLILGGYTYRSSENIGLTETEVNDVRARIIPKNSVIMCCVGDIGITSIAGDDFVMNQQLHSFQCSELINNIFLCIILPYYKNQMIKRATSTTVLYLNKSSCNSIEIILPPIELQTQFANIVTKIEEQKTLVKKAIDEAQHLFDSLMSEYFE